MRLRRLAVVLAALTLVGAAPAVDPTARFFEELQEVEERGPADVDRWPLLDRCAREIARPVDDDQEQYERENACRTFAQFFATQGSAGDRERLWAFLDREPAASSLREGIVRDLLEARVKEVLEGLHLPKARVAATLDAPEPRADRRPPSLQHAVRAYRTLTAHYDTFLRTAQKTRSVDYLMNGAAFQAAVASYLRHDVSPVEAATRIAEFMWGGWCGTGSDGLADPQSQAILLAALEQEDYALAAAAVMHLGRWELMFGEPPAGRAQLLAAAGFDWEEVLVGGVLDGEQRFLLDLGRAGGERAARLLLDARRSNADRDPWRDARFDNALAAFVTPGDECRQDDQVWPISTDDVTRAPDGPRVSDALQAEILATLSGEGSGLEDETGHAQRLLRLCRRESRPAFQRMLESRYEAVRERAWKTLTALGENVSRPESHPVQFQLRRDGVLLRNTPVEVAAIYGCGGRGEPVTMVTDDEGTFEVSPDWFVDRLVTRLYVVAGGENAFRDPTFAISLPVPRSRRALTIVDVPSARLPGAPQ